jgi:hypothetical protein
MTCHLLELQKEFLAGLETGSEPQSLRAGSRFHVYSRAYKIRLKESIEEDFPETLSQMPEKEKVLDKFIRSHRSSFWTLAEYSKKFPEFCSQFYPRDSKLIYTAKLEYAKCLASSIGDPDVPPPMSIEGEIVVVLNPSIQVVSEGDRHALVYFAKGDLVEEVVKKEEVIILNSFLAKVPVSKLDHPESQILSFVTRATSTGLIIGFESKP